MHAAQIQHELAGQAARDSTTAELPDSDFTACIGQSIMRMCIAFELEYLGVRVDPVLAAKIMPAACQLVPLGATVSVLSLPHTQYADSSYTIIASSVPSSNY